MKITHRPDPAPLRRDAYPSIGDQLDAIWKALRANPDLLPPDTQAMLQKIDEVKTNYPKPDTGKIAR